MSDTSRFREGSLVWLKFEDEKLRPAFVLKIGRGSESGFVNFSRFDTQAWEEVRLMDEEDFHAECQECTEEELNKYILEGNVPNLTVLEIAMKRFRYLNSH